MKVAVGLSGGVDSALAAALLAEQGHEVTGVFLECWPADAKAMAGKNEPCRGDKDSQDALGVALKLKIPFKVLDFKREYKEKVLEWFYKEYKAGRTPNPDVMCNREIKFGLFLEWSLKNGFEKVATGHYARLLARHTKFPGAPASPVTYARSSAPEICVSAPISLIQPVDKQKDQTYFLALLKQKQLEKVMFPIGHLTKKQVRVEAKKRGLKVWDKKDSTGICLIGHDYSFEEFLKRKIKEHEGEVVNKKGKIIGKHKGVEFYTIGQRHGFAINAKFQMSNAKRQFVVVKNVKENQLVVGSKKDLERKEFEVGGWSWIGGPRTRLGAGLRVRIRHQGRLIACRVEGKKVFLKTVEYGIAPGQVAVIYKMEGSDPSECLGGGVIKS